LLLLVAIVFTAAGVGYDLTGGLQPLRSLLFWAPLGFAAGFVAASVRELARNTVTSLSSFGKNRSYAILGAAPELTPRVLRQLPPDKRTPLGCLAFQPSSPFATAFRDLQSALTKDGVVAFTAAVADEGATTAALCTAIAASQQGRTVVVIDCDLRRRSLTRGLGFDPDEGLVDACEEAEPMAELRRRRRRNRLALHPGLTRAQPVAQRRLARRASMNCCCACASIRTDRPGLPASPRRRRWRRRRLAWPINAFW
jgi:hypothetical protein